MEDTPMKKIPDIEHWSENFAISAYDPKASIHLHFHIGRWRKDLTLWREVMAIALPDGTAIAHRGIGNARASAMAPGGGNLAAEVIEQDNKIHYTFLGGVRRTPRQVVRDQWVGQGPMERLELDLMFISDQPVWDLERVGQTTAYTGREHIEQLGRFEGTIKIGSDKFSISTLCNRDHSRGPRVVDGVKRHSWLQAMFDNGISILGYEAESMNEDAPAFSEACVYQDGKLYSAALKLGYRLPLDNPYPRLNEPVPMTVEYEKGNLEIVAEEMRTTISTQYTSPWDLYPGRRSENGVDYRSVAHQAVHYRLDGKVRGYGHMERTVPGPIYPDP
jgi:hypothetical protein